MLFTKLCSTVALRLKGRRSDNRLAKSSGDPVFETVLNNVIPPKKGVGIYEKREL